jgi:hypothetical protein
MKTACIFLIGLLCAMGASAADLDPSKLFGQQGAAEQTIVAGLKEALAKGVERAVTNLNREGGFLGNSMVRIEFPEKLAKVEKTLRALKQEALIDELKTNMNRAAESAVGEAGPIFGDAVRNMTIEEGTKILHGPEDAATQYFRKASETRLKEKMLPLIESATSKSGAAATYKTMLQKAQGGFSFLSPFTKQFDLDSYVNQKTADGVYKMIAEEEKKIRANPEGQASEVIKSVFGKILKQ